MNHEHHHMTTLPSFFDLQLWNLEFLFITIALAVLYFLLIGPWRHRFANSTEVSFKHKVLFISGLLLLFIGLGSPINNLGHHYFFSLHMLEMSIIYLAMPPLLILGLPDWFYRSLLGNKKTALYQFVTNPFITVISFNVLFSIYHLPLVFDFIMASHVLLMTLFHSILFLFAFLMWWPVFCPVPELARLSSLQKLAYIFSNGVLITPACALIIFAESLIYQTYMGVPTFSPLFTPIDDQQTGGIIMKVMQEIIYGSILAYIFYHWYRSENTSDQIDPIV